MTAQFIIQVRFGKPRPLSKAGEIEPLEKPDALKAPQIIKSGSKEEWSVNHPDLLDFHRSTLPTVS